MTNSYLLDAKNLLRTDALSEEYRAEWLRSVLTIFQQTLMQGVHTGQNKTKWDNERCSISRIMSGELEGLEHALESCSTEYAIRGVIHSYVQILRKGRSQTIMSEKEKRILRFKIICIASIGLILKQYGRTPKKWEPIYDTLERLLIASLSATSMFEKWIEIPELDITFQVS